MSGEWNWPEWVPVQERKLIESFWVQHGGADGWRRAFIEKHVHSGQPAEFGEHVVGFWTEASHGVVREYQVAAGRWVPRWNTVGVMVIDGTDDVAFLPRVVRNRDAFNPFMDEAVEEIKAARAAQEAAGRRLLDLCEAQKKALDLLKAKSSTLV